MPGSDPQTGDVYYYPYIWKRQAWGESEKDRPCCVAIRLGANRLRGCDTILVALTQSGVPDGGYGIEVPPELIREHLARLDSSQKTYIVTSEFNSDVSDKPSFEDCEYLGTLPMDFVKGFLRGMQDHIISGAGEVRQV